MMREVELGGFFVQRPPPALALLLSLCLPMVGTLASSNSPDVKRSSRDDLPTPESPTKRIWFVWRGGSGVRESA
jgi:hypothetical protein